MDWLKIKLEVLSKYKYVLLIIILGISLMLWPSNKKEGETIKTEEISVQDDQDSITKILQQVRGAGRVEVFLKIERSEEYIYQTDSDSNASSDRTDINKKTILITDSGRNQTGLIQTILSPKYMGAVIVCQGADDPSVKLSIIDAVSKVTGLGSDKISVLKMK